MTRWVEFPVDTYLDRRHRNWVLAEEFGDVRFSGGVVLVDPVRAEHIARALRGSDEVLLEEVLALPARTTPGAARPSASSVDGRVRVAEPPPPDISTARSRWRNILGWLGIIAGAAVFVAALAMPLDDPALVVAVALVMRGGRLILDIDS